MPDRTPKKRNSCASLFLVALLAICCLAGLGLFLGLQYLPSLAQNDFGIASGALNIFQKALYSFELFLAKDNLVVPVDLSGTNKQFTISPGESVNSISLKLENLGLVHDAASFKLYLVYTGMDKNIQAGNYQLSPALTAMEIAKAIQDSSLKDATFRILAGWRVEELAASLVYSGLTIKPADFLQMTKNSALLQDVSGIKSVRNLEGFLLPDSYTFKRDATSDDVLRGIIQAVVDAEKPTIASVFINRLKKGIKLDSDPTVQYALGYDENKKTWWKNPLSLQDLKVSSTYNTYLYTGLPPGPICNPGLSALRAVAFPAQTPYYYFRARCDGSGRHAFAMTYDEHLKNACP